jgi:hypothetical protein
MAEATNCPHCGKPVPPGTPGGLCPECLVKVGIGSEASDPTAGPKRPAPAPPPLETIARHFPQLEILELLGCGGMGAVYKARQREIDRLVALKILPSEAASDPGFAERFTREARALARLSHPNIVALYEFGHVDGLHYFIMEFVDGLSLRQLEQAGRLSPREALQIIPQICEALQFAHDEGIVHRDIKPENVLLDKKGRVKIADFGLARILGHEPEDFRLTRAREVMGTPHYMAPEQVEKPQSVDHRADIYSLGVVFYEMLTGELPLGRFAPPSQKVHVDVRLDEVVLRALEKEPERRYQQASQVKTDMETIMGEQPASISRSAGARAGVRSPEGRYVRRVVATTVAVMLTVLVVSAALVWIMNRTPMLREPEAGANVEETKVAATEASLTAPPPETAKGWYYVSGEVRTPNRRLYEGRITLLQAITSAGDFTAFADKKRVRLTRADGTSQIVNCTKAQGDASLDPEVHPGDTVFVGRRMDFDSTPTSPSAATNDESAQRYTEDLRRRYGLRPTPAPLNPPTNGTSPADTFARRYGLAPSAAVVPPGKPDVNAAFASRYGLRPSRSQSSPAGENPSFSAIGTEGGQLSYQWRPDPNATNGPMAPAPEGLSVTKLTPLYLKLALDNIVEAESGKRYVIGVQREAAPIPKDRAKRQYYCSLHSGGVPDLFMVLNAQAPPGNASNVEVVLEVKGLTNLVTISKDHPFERIEGYAADLRFEPENKTFINRRIGDVLKLAGDEVAIIAITRFEVVMRAKSSGKTWAVECKGAAGVPEAVPAAESNPTRP